MGTLTRHAATSPSDAAAMCAAGAGRTANICFEVSYVQKKRAALGAEPIAAGPRPA